MQNSLLRKFETTGQVDFGWLQSNHSFSFGHYYDPNWMGFGPLRVINNDHVAPARGFDPHAHANMEILSYVISGTLKHGDSFGQDAALIKTAEFQLLSAGSGMRHSEYNASATDPVHFLQIWLEPNEKNVPPRYQQLAALPATQTQAKRLILSPTGQDGSLHLRQDAKLWQMRLTNGSNETHTTTPNRLNWVQVVSGDAKIQEQHLTTGDGIGFSGTENLNLTAQSDCEILVFDLPI